MKRRAQPWLGTLVEITIADSLNDDALIPCFASAFAAIAEVHRLMSFHEAASDLSRINYASAGESVAVHPHTYKVLSMALQLSQATDGIFDIACAPRLAQNGHLPKLEGVVPDYHPRCASLALEDGQRIRKLRAAWVDVGGIAKGYAVDMAVEALRRCGIRSACVNAGGDLRVFGEISYPVSIRNPRAPGEIGDQIILRDEALATSANYFSRNRMNGTASSALINGQNGCACDGEFSVSVRAPTCMLADALTKVVAASGNARHAVLAQFDASAFII